MLTDKRRLYSMQFETFYPVSRITMVVFGLGRWCDATCNPIIGHVRRLLNYDNFRCITTHHVSGRGQDV